MRGLPNVLSTGSRQQAVTEMARSNAAPEDYPAASVFTPMQAALQLAEEYGVPVFPCGNDKRPHTQHGFKDASTNLETIESFWRQWPDALIGVPTGIVSKILVVDVDPDGQEWHSRNVGQLQCARVHATRRGYHLLYRMPDLEIRNSASTVAVGIDVRAEGGYIIWWPAHGYNATGSLDELTEPPMWLLRVLTTERPQRAPSKHTSAKIPEGTRNDTLFRLAAGFRRAGAGSTELSAAVDAFNGRCEKPLDDVELDSIVRSAMRYPAEPHPHIEIPERIPLDWKQLSQQKPPVRDWAIEHWLGMRHVTLLSGGGGSGKTSMAQAMASCLALRTEYLDRTPTQRTVLMWACEDDTQELWRRQSAIAEWLGVPLSDFAGRLHLHSYDGAQVELAAHVDQRRLRETPMMSELCAQIGDYRADVVVLDNIARLFAGNENDRHDVTAFIAMLTAAALPTGAAVLLLGHPGKAAGSEYSGSTAWEGAVRSRLYLGSSLPDMPRDKEDSLPDDEVRYLSRRKANYSSRDWRRIRYVNGVMVPEPPPQQLSEGGAPNQEYMSEVVVRAVRQLAQIAQYGTASRASPNYLPKLARHYNLLENVTEKQFAATMRKMQLAGTLGTAVVGKYTNRTPRHGLVISEPNE
jgi:RecA-family ATPase